MLHVTLGDRRPIDPEADELGRDHVGFDRSMSVDDLWESNRGCWVLGERADGERYVLFSHKGVVVQAGVIDAIVETISKRRAIVGRPLGNGERVHDVYVGGPAPVQGVRNPITYVADPRFDSKLCFCGCGAPVSRGDWIPGHDQKALHERIAKIGSVKQFIEWFDSQSLAH